MTEELSPLRLQRRDKILDAAEHLFVTNGVRATTVEELAHTASMSKVTVYSYFNDKDAVFAAVADRVASRLQDAFMASLAAEKPLPERVAGALIAKHRIIFDLVRRSAHAEELFSAKSRTSAGRFQKLDSWLIAQLTDALRPEVDDADLLATLLFDASQGIANGAENPGVMETSIVLLTRLI